MNPFTNAVVIGIFLLLYYVADAPWLALTVLGLRIAWWIFYEVVTSRAMKKRGISKPKPTPRKAPLSGLPKSEASSSTQSEDLSSGSTTTPAFCTSCGTPRSGAGQFCVECGSTFTD